MKRLLVGLASAALAGAMCLSMAACGGTKYSETFRGAVSETTYESADAAVKGFLEEEVSGLTVKAEYVGYEKEAELTQSEIGELELGEYAEGLISAEKGQVEYRETAESTAISSISDGTITRTVYILSYTDMFRFFVPPVNTGETLTAKYYDSVLQADKYYNCTMHAVLSGQDEYSGEAAVVTSAIAKVTETALYEEDYNSKDFSGEPFMRSYGVDKEGSIFWCSKETGSSDYEVMTRYDFPVKEYFSMWFDMRFGNLDHTYFEKTETGYALRADKYAALMETLHYGRAEDYDLEYVFNIADGRWADVHMKIAYTGFESIMDLEFTDFGSTEVTVPDEVKALFA